MSDKDILRPLVDKVLDLAERPQEQATKQLWARFNALAPAGKIPVCVTWEGIPAAQWDLVFGTNHLRCADPLARLVEFDLKRRAWMAQNVPDDHVVWPAVGVPAVQIGEYDWGVPIRWADSGDELGAKSIVAPFADGIDLSRLRQPVTRVAEAATRERLERVEDLVDGLLAAQPRYPRLGDVPFDVAVEMRGMEALFLDACDAPDLLHGLMDFLTSAIIADHKGREANGWINAPPDPSGRYQMVPIWRHIAATLPAGFADRPPRLADEWAYVSAQTSSGLGPEMYEQFVNRYNARIAALYTAQTVYYHGCECLDQKLDSIAKLPNLRRHHVSPWSSVRKAAEKFQGSVVLEVHVHPTEVLFTASRPAMRAQIDRLIADAAGHPMCLNLSDIHSLNGNPDTLRIWAQAAQQAVA